MEGVSAQDFTPQIMFGKVVHKRLTPKVNGFTYGIYYLSLPLSGLSPAIENKYFKLNRFGLLSFHAKDHGYRDGGDLQTWAQDQLQKFDIKNCDGEIVLVTLPRVMGYVFNPVSFWLCYDRGQNLRAVICEVNNTFGQTHSYICAHEDGRPLESQDFTQSDKVFHVSPFITRDGGYHFRFHAAADKFGAWIDYFNKDGQKLLLTALNGKYTDLDQKAAGRAFWRYPLVTLKAIALIHWQAVKLLVKGCEYIPKPEQFEGKVTRAVTLDK